MLRLTPCDAGGWGFTLFEELPWGLESLVVAAPERALPLRRAVVDAVAADGYAPEAVGLHRKRPFNLTQSPGVRLALQALAVAPLRSTARRTAVVGALEAMSDEECLYWFAKARGHEGRRALRALRLLLASD